MRLFKKRTLDDRLALVLVRALEHQFPQQWTSLSEARRPKKPDLRITNWTVERNLLYGFEPELTVTLRATGWVS